MGFGLSASVPMRHPRRLPSRLTSRSSRRRVVASLKLPGMRAILAPIRRVRRGLTPALCAVLQCAHVVHGHCNIPCHQTLPQLSTARFCQFHVRAARLPARQRSGWFFAPDGTRLMKLFAPASPRSGWAALWASVTGLGRQPSSLHPVLTGSRLSAPINPRDIVASPG